MEYYFFHLFEGNGKDEESNSYFIKWVNDLIVVYLNL